jgi:hypothetical protein
MAYGNAKYSTFVKKNGDKIFGNKIRYIEKFVSREEYIISLQKVNICVMYHNRQQGFGNCIPLLMLGVKLYLKEGNSLYQYLKSIGVIVFCTSEISNMNFEKFSKPLTDIQKNQNKLIIYNLFSQDRRLEYLNKILN